MIVRLLLLIVFFVTLQLNPEAAGQGGDSFLQVLTQLITKLDDTTPVRAELKSHIKEFTAYKISDDKRVNSLLVQVLTHGNDIKELIKLNNEEQKETARKRSEIDDTFSEVQGQILVNGNKMTAMEGNLLEINEEFSEEKIATRNKLEMVESSLLELKEDNIQLEDTNTELSNKLEILEGRFNQLEIALEDKISDLFDKFELVEEQVNSTHACEDGRVRILGWGQAANYYTTNLFKSGGVWRQHGQTSGPAITFSEWYTSAHGGGNCVFLEKHYSYKWNSYGCGSTEDYICKF